MFPLSFSSNCLQPFVLLIFIKCNILRFVEKKKCLLFKLPKYEKIQALELFTLLLCCFPLFLSVLFDSEFLLVSDVISIVCFCSRFGCYHSLKKNNIAWIVFFFCVTCCSFLLSFVFFFPPPSLSTLCVLFSSSIGFLLNCEFVSVLFSSSVNFCFFFHLAVSLHF